MLHVPHYRLLFIYFSLGICGPFSNHIFGQVDTQAPTIVSIGYDCGNEGLRIELSEPIDCSSIALGSLSLNGATAPLTLTSFDCVSLAGTTNLLRIHTNPIISELGSYNLDIAGGISDTSGNEIAPNTFSFDINNLSQEISIVGSTNEVCLGDSVFLTSDVFPGSNASYTWTPGNYSTERIAVLPTDTTRYQVLVTWASGCANSVDSITINTKPLPIGNAGIDREFCQGQAGVTLNGGPAANNQAPLPFSYTWFPSEGLNNSQLANPFAKPDNSTNYLLSVTSVNGCTSVDTLGDENTVEVRVKEIPAVSIDLGSDTLMCKGDTLALSGTVVGAGPDYQYSWTPLTTGYLSDPDSFYTQISPGFTTVYFFSASSDGCLGKADSIRVVVEESPTISAGSDQNICLGDTIQLLGTALGDPLGTIYSYEWSPSQGIFETRISQPLTQPDTTTTYRLTARSNFGCGSNVDSVTITVAPSPIAQILTPDTTVCEGEAFFLRSTASFTTTPPGNPLTYTWAATPDLPSGGFGAEIPLIPVNSSTYILTTSIAGSCPTKDSIRVEVVPKLRASIQADTNRICSGESLQLTGSTSPGFTYQWFPTNGLSDPSAPDPLASPDTTTQYQLIVSNEGCRDSAQFELTVIPTPNSEYLFSSNVGCVGLEVSFFADVSVPASFIWDFGDGSPVSNEQNPVHAFNIPGDFPVQLTTIGPSGCASESFSTTVSVSDTAFAAFSSDPPPRSTLVLPKSEVKFVDQSQNGTSWLWNFGDGSSSNEMNTISHTYTEEGSFMVELLVTDQNGCVSTLSLGPYIIVEPELFIPNVFSPNRDGLNDAYQVRYTGSDVFSLLITDRWGNPFFEAKSPNLSWNGTREGGNDAPEGVYYYHVQIGEKNYQGNLTLLR